MPGHGIFIAIAGWNRLDQSSTAGELGNFHSSEMSADLNFVEESRPFEPLE